MLRYMEEPEIQVATRVNAALHAKIVERQQEAKKAIGVEPSISAIVRVLLEEALSAKKKKR